MRQLMLLLIAIAMPLLTSCATLYLGGRPVVNVPDYFSDTYVEFTGCDNPQQPRTKVQENLGSGGVAYLWGRSGAFRLYPSTLVKQITITYDGKTFALRGPSWSWSVPNRQDNGVRTMTVSIIYQPEDGPQREWEGSYSVINNNLVEVKRGWR